MRVLHRDGPGLKPMRCGKGEQRRVVVVGHQERASQPRSGREKPLMVKRVVRVKPFPGPLAGRGIRRIDEEDSALRLNHSGRATRSLVSQRL
jgi:hypothetical protein